MKFYYTPKRELIQYNPESKVGRIRNVKDGDIILSQEEFDAKEKVEIKRQEFSRLMNEFFKNISHTWKHDGYKFKKLPNFEKESGWGGSFIKPYEYKDLPKHNCGVYGECIIVYHWGRIYYFTISYNGYPQGQLLDIKTKEAVRWARARHCAPIKNMGKGLII